MSEDSDLYKHLANKTHKQLAQETLFYKRNNACYIEFIEFLGKEEAFEEFFEAWIGENHRRFSQEKSPQ